MDIANRASMSFAAIREAAGALLEAGLLKPILEKGEEAP